MWKRCDVGGFMLVCLQRCNQRSPNRPIAQIALFRRLYPYQNVSSSSTPPLLTTLGLSSSSFSKSDVTFPPAVSSKSLTICFDASLAMPKESSVSHPFNHSSQEEPPTHQASSTTAPAAREIASSSADSSLLPSHHHRYHYPKRQPLSLPFPLEPPLAM